MIEVIGSKAAEKWINRLFLPTQELDFAMIALGFQKKRKNRFGRQQRNNSSQVSFTFYQKLCLFFCFSSQLQLSELTPSWHSIHSMDFWVDVVISLPSASALLNLLHMQVIESIVEDGTVTLEEFSGLMTGEIGGRDSAEMVSTHNCMNRLILPPIISTLSSTVDSLPVVCF